MQDSLLSASMTVFQWAANVYNGGFMNDFFTVTSNGTITIREVNILDAILQILVQNLFLGGRCHLEIYKWLPNELHDGEGTSQQIPIFVGVLVLATILLFILPLSVIILSYKCGCCYKRHSKNTSDLLRLQNTVSFVAVFCLSKR